MRWLFVLLLAACSVSHKSGEFTTCDRSADCAGDQACSNGVCVALGTIDAPDIDAGKPDALVCPSQCTSCRIDRMECRVDCAISPATCNAPIACPAGWNCTVACSTPNSCKLGVACADAKRCNVTCSGADACTAVTCGDGPCDVQCTGARSCNTMTCGTSCACDVRCGIGSNCRRNLTCTAAPLGCGSLEGCSSTLNPACNTCP
jgi:hypothetical protein